MNKEYKVISFDMFQTLVDVNQKVFEIWDKVLPGQCTNEQASTYAQELFIDYATIMKLEMQKTEFVSMQGIFYKCAKSMIRRVNLSICASDLADSLIRAHLEAPLYDDVIGVLEYLRRKQYLIIISSDSDINMYNINVSKLDISHQYLSEKLRTYKNNKNKKFFEPIIKELNINPSEIVHIGDGYSDSVAAGYSGIDFIFLNRNYYKNMKNLNARYVVNRLDELKSIL